MIICFEGPSAIGKTTLCQSLQQEYNIIPEANVLFKRSSNETPFQYIDYQCKRYQLAKQQTPSILDGDIFQPLWYNWTFQEPISADYYIRAIEENRIQFPDIYFLFYTDLQELIKRKDNDANRQRRNFTKHLALIHSQQQYFNFLKEHTSIPVIFIEYTSVKDTRDHLLQHLSTFTPSPKNDLADLKTISLWLRP
ncbi:hypothetical protein [Chitinophaga sp. LS1]|uniref:hypothetical protein n=1 Tax=Chitinophaga sp. LS1 TaxID=3051176 RepID=UPI002AAC1BD5|nr:hypothetical protein [Chitinophaga sp. LS1]WPV67956.1 hypothetical protein QQL36_04355 [Chitinophaga sp. LS1]